MELDEPISTEPAIEADAGDLAEEEEGANEVEEEPQEIETESEDYSLLSESEDPEKKAAYHEYKLLEKHIRYQNKTVENLKDDIKKMENTRLSRSDKCDLKKLHNALSREMIKLQELIRKAIRLQTTGSKRHYRDLPLVTTFDEDNFNLNHRTCETLHNLTRKAHAKRETQRVSASDSSEMNTSVCQGSRQSDSQERKLINKVVHVLKEHSGVARKGQHRNRNRATPCKGKKSIGEMKNHIKCMQQAISQLSKECNKKANSPSRLEANGKLCAASPDIDPAMLCLCQSLDKTNKYQQLKENYLYLLTEFSKKDEQLKELTTKVKNSCSKCIGGAVGQGDAIPMAEPEMHLLRNRVREMEEEQVEFKCLMREQSLQLDEYRNKYIIAQQKVEEQSVVIDRLNTHIKCIQNQINQEVKEIRAKFKEKLANLAQYPKLLENEQIKLAEMSKEKADIESKLIIVCKELKNLKSKPQNPKEEDLKPLLNKCQDELSRVKKNMEEIQRQRDMFCEKLRTTMEDLNTLRSESAKIVARTKERADQIKQQQQVQIDRLEKQLAQCRATASLTVNDRESVIKEMQGQLNTLSYSFDAAQKQIKTLRNHIAYMSNENSYPVKC